MLRGRALPGGVVVDAGRAAAVAALPGARRHRVDLSGGAGALAEWSARALAGLTAALLILPVAARAQATDFVPVSSIAGIEGVRRLDDGSLRLELAGGGVITVAAEDVRETEAGTFLISLAAFDGAVAALPLAAGLGAAGPLGALAAGAATVACRSDPEQDDPGDGDAPPPSGTGYVVDGYVVDARVFRDLDLDGAWDEGLEPATRSRADGSFDLALLPGRGPLYADGGYDLTTGQAVSVRFAAPDGATILSPLSTLIWEHMAATAEAGSPLTAAEAEAELRAALGLGDASLLGRDPMAEAEAGDTAAFAAAARVANVLATAEAPGADAAAVAAALAAAITAAPPGADPLADAAAITAALAAGLGAPGPSTARLGRLLAEAAPAPGAAIEAIENSLETVAVTLAGMVRAGADLPDSFAEILAANRPFTPSLADFDGVVSRAENAAGAEFAGHGLAGSRVTVTLAGQSETATVAEDGSWTVAFAPRAFAEAGRFDLSVVAERTVDGLQLTSRSLTREVVIDLSGPQIAGEMTGTLTEDEGAGEPGTLTAAGQLAMTEPGAAVFLAQAGTAGAHGLFTLGADGGWTYAADNGQDAIQALGAGAALTERFAVATADGAEAVVTVTIAGVNDAATIGGMATGTVTEDAAATLRATGTLDVTDVDAGEAVFVAQAGTAGSHGLFTLGTDGAWAYAADNGQDAIQALGAGATLTERFAVATADGTAGSVTVTISGVNDAPTVSATAAAAITEAAEAAAQDLADAGTVGFGDVDGGDAVTVAFTPNDDIAWSGGDLAADLATALVAGFSTGVTGADAPGQTGWSLAADDLALDFLAGGETITWSHTVTATDRAGAEASATVGFTITGTNDVPAVAEIAPVALTETVDSAAITDQITVTFTDVDLSQTGHAATVTSTGTDGVTEGLGLDAEALAALMTAGVVTKSAGETGGSVPLTFSAASTVFDYLAAGEAVTLGYDITVDDGALGSGTRAFAVTITGTNDAPVLADIAPVELTETTDSAAITDQITVAFTDADLSDAGHAAVVTYTGASGVTGGLDGIDLAALMTAGAVTKAAGETGGSVPLTFSAEVTVFDYLIEGETVTLGYRISIGDGEGTGTRDISVTITGANDAAVITGDMTGEVAERAAEVATGTLRVADPDGADTFVAQTGAAGTYGTLTLEEDGGWTYTLDPAKPAVQALRGGEVAQDDFTVASADGTEAVLRVTVTGTTAPVDLSDAAGLVITGAAGDGGFTAMAVAGDVNDDGIDDLILGVAGRADKTGGAYVLFGGSESIDLGAIAEGESNAGFFIEGEAAGDRAGVSVSGAGDVNGDGKADVILGAWLNSDSGLYAGASYVVYGKDIGTPVALSDLAGDEATSGFAIRGAAAIDLSGEAVGGAGDVDGDGLSDVIVGAPFGEAPEQRPDGDTPGLAYVVYGKAGGGAVGLADVEGNDALDGFVIVGETSGAAFDNGQLGTTGTVAIAGDVNGDGRADLVVSAPQLDADGVQDTGAAYVVYGAAGEARGDRVDLAAIDTAGSRGFSIKGAAAGDHLGHAVSGAGDVNGDGYADVIVSARQADGAAGENAGESFVVFGGPGLGAISLGDLRAGTGGFVITGAESGDLSGGTVSAAGDVNGDAFGDLIVTARSGVYVIFGKPDGGAVALADVAAGLGGFVITLPQTEGLQSQVTGAADLNGDGFDDVVISTYVPGVDTATIHVVHGGDLTGAVTRVGTEGADTIIGTGEDETFYAGLADDLLSGGGGADRLSGGAGADTFRIDDVAGTTTILDFDPGEGDRLDLSDFGFADFAAVAAVLSPGGPGGHDARLQLDGDTALVLEGFAADLLAADHVALVPTA
ncbi:MAG: VCBS domain-containing protein [Rhodobacteraceae bacterium]|nr:VCBS domain-containing protein [Paracoccaceae bacterium]